MKLINTDHPLYRIGHTRGVLCGEQFKASPDGWYEATKSEENSRHFAKHVGFDRLTDLEWWIYGTGVHDGIESVLGKFQFDHQQEAEQ